MCVGECPQISTRGAHPLFLFPGQNSMEFSHCDSTLSLSRPAAEVTPFGRALCNHFSELVGDNGDRVVDCNGGDGSNGTMLRSQWRGATEGMTRLQV